MRDEVSGKEALQRTTLRSLGLTGGSAILRYVVKGSNTPGPGEPMETAATPTDAIATATASQPPPEHLEAPSGAPTAVNPALSDKPAEPTPAPVPSETPSPPCQSTAHMRQTLPVQPEEAEPSQDQQQAVRPKIRQAVNQQQPRAELQADDEQPGPSHASLPPPSNFVPFSGGGQRLGGSAGLPRSSSSSSSLSPLPSGPPKAKKAKPSHEVQRLQGSYRNVSRSDGESTRLRSGLNADVLPGRTCLVFFGRCLDGGPRRVVDPACRLFHILIGSFTSVPDSPSTALTLQPLDRKPLVYHLDTAARHSRNDEELTDEFFEVTVDDVRKRFSQLKSERYVYWEPQNPNRVRGEAACGGGVWRKLCVCGAGWGDAASGMLWRESGKR
ncbi:hypothetical protein NFI96_030742 [Prochilodus magdalenae]|nr:hypothetical protein NFI96_030742 [Prochilodus magdalenae]